MLYRKKIIKLDFTLHTEHFIEQLENMNLEFDRCCVTTQYDMLRNSEALLHKDFITDEQFDNVALTTRKAIISHIDRLNNFSIQFGS